MVAPAKKKLSLSRGSTAVTVATRLALFVFAVLVCSAYIMSQLDDLAVIDVAPYFIVAIALQLLPFVVRPKADPFEPAGLTSALHLLALVPAFMTYIVNRQVTIALLPHLSGRARIELVQTVLIAYSVGSVAYFVGYYQKAGRRLSAMFPNVAGFEWDRSRLIAVTAVCFGLFIPAYAYFQIRVGGSITDITRLAAGKAVWREDATMSWLMRAVGLGFIPPLLFVTLNFPKLRWMRAAATGFALFAVAFLTTRLGQRGIAIFFIVNALIVVHYLWRRIPMTLLAALAFVMLVGANLLGAYRSSDESSFTASSPGPTANLSATQTLVEHEDDRERIAAIAVAFHFFPERKDYLMGESWAYLAVAFIPRWLWPEKANKFMWRDTRIVPELVGAPVPLSYLGLLYANFSWVGIILGMGFWGLVQRGMYEWLLKDPRDRNVVILYSFIVVYFTPTALQISATIGYVLPLYVAIRYMRKKVGQKKKALPAARPAGERLLSAAPEPAAPAGGATAAE